MSNVVSLTGGGQSAAGMKPQPSVVEALEKLLDEAKAGRIQHIVAIYSDGAGMPGDLYQGSGEPWQVATLIGAMELCKHTMLMTQYQDHPV